LPPKILVTLGCLAAVTPAFAQDGLKQDGLKHDSLKPAPRQITLLSTHDPVSDVCRRVDGIDLTQFVPVSLHRTFHDDFDEHPLAHSRWTPHYSGGAAWPEARY